MRRIGAVLMLVGMLDVPVAYSQDCDGAATHRFWDGEGEDANFITPENWDPDGTPCPEDDVTVDDPDAVVVYDDESGALEVQNLATADGASVEFSGGDLNADEVQVGVGTAGAFNMTGGVLRCQRGGDDDFRVGFDAEGRFEVSDGEITASDDFIVGHFAPGVLNVSGGTLEGGYTVVANNPGSGGSAWNMSGGLFICRNDLECGDDDEGTINHSGGTMYIGSSLSVGNRTGMGFYNASGEAVIDCTRGTGNILIGVGRDGSAGGTGVFTIEGPDVTILGNNEFNMDPGLIAEDATLVARITAETHSTILVRGNADVTRGRLEVELDGYSPVGGEEYVLLEANADITDLSEFTDAVLDGLDGTVTGPFAEVVTAPLPAGLEWEVDYEDTSILLYVLGDISQPRFVRSDVNGDGRVDLTDGVAVLSFLFAGAADPPCLDAADADDHDGVNVTDAVFVFSFLFSGGGAPPPPGPTGTSATGAECGVDPTPDDLGCASAPGYCG